MNIKGRFLKEMFKLFIFNQILKYRPQNLYLKEAKPVIGQWRGNIGRETQEWGGRVGRRRGAR